MIARSRIITAIYHLTIYCCWQVFQRVTVHLWGEGWHLGLYQAMCLASPNRWWTLINMSWHLDFYWRDLNIPTRARMADGLMRDSGWNCSLGLWFRHMEIANVRGTYLYGLGERSSVINYWMGLCVGIWGEIYCLNGLKKETAFWIVVTFSYSIISSTELQQTFSRNNFFKRRGSSLHSSFNFHYQEIVQFES